MAEGLYADASGVDAARSQLDDLTRKVATIAMDVHDLQPTFTGDDELTKTAMEKLGDFHRSIAQIVAGLTVALNGDAQRTAATAQIYQDTAQKNEEIAAEVTRPFGGRKH